MNIFGYEKDEENLLNMSEVTMKLNCDQLLELKEFVSYVIDQYQQHGDEFGHEHFNDFRKVNDSSDLIICIKK